MASHSFNVEPRPPDEIVQLLHSDSQHMYIREPALYNLLACEGSNATRILKSRILIIRNSEVVPIHISTQATLRKRDSTVEGHEVHDGYISVACFGMNIDGVHWQPYVFGISSPSAIAHSSHHFLSQYSLDIGGDVSSSYINHGISTRRKFGET
ncbi:uncharacterized protein F5147DRAFT_282705 [Suillus discolor]|uniref:Uncharacterized protein n=1 Tax=Suillus discolor TaxID=1912936 RepID=A0A9P7JRQ8_9AGAM|nr:uncharacterized protein F5147DRAFT_282705 [Suillus discolor]KAG2103046.1 hypothetical protein F5147DRAFT_282705 [Suillus discolor]